MHSTLCKLLSVLLLLTLLTGTACAESAAFRGWNKTDKYQYIQFGEYPQESNGDVKPVLWRVLSAGNGQALLQTEYVIDAEPIIVCDDKKMQEKHSYRRITTFEESDLYPWLSDVMAVNLFTPDELAALDWSRGKVFILNFDEFCNVEYGYTRTVYGEGDVPQLRCRKTLPTAYAKKKGNIYCQEGGCTYWVDNVKGKNDYKMGIVGFNGHMSYGAYHRTNIGIRACILVNADQVAFTSGSGTQKDPYVLQTLASAGDQPAPTEPAKADEDALTAEEEMAMMMLWVDDE